MVYYSDQIKAGMIHDHIETYSVKFWYTKDDGYRGTNTITMWIEEGDEWDKVLKALKKRYKDPDIISVKYQQAISTLRLCLPNTSGAPTLAS